SRSVSGRRASHLRHVRRALPDRPAPYFTKERAGDEERRELTDVPDELSFTAKPQLAAAILRKLSLRFKRIASERELAQFFTPDESEIAWAAKRTHERPESFLMLLVLLKSCVRLGYFPSLDKVPIMVIAHVRAAAGLPKEVVPGTEERTAKRYRSWIREYLGLVHDPARARGIAAAAMEEAAPVRASVVDLIDVALEELVRAGLELPGFSTLNRMAASIKTRVEGEICARIGERVGWARPRLAGLLVVPDGERHSPFDVIKEPGRRATWSRFRQHGKRVDLVDGFDDAASWVESVAAAKVSAFAEQAQILSVARCSMSRSRGGRHCWLARWPRPGRGCAMSSW
ncbi:DUF4158 domain-containing protein, partial [Streptomyces sp. NPDC002285]